MTSVVHPPDGLHGMVAPDGPGQTRNSVSALPRTNKRPFDESADDSGYDDDTEPLVKRPRQLTSYKRPYSLRAGYPVSDHVGGKPPSGEPPSKRKDFNDDDHVPFRRRLFACPFTAHDPARYSHLNAEERRYSHCANVFLTSIPRLKQHIYRVHQRPRYNCSQCFEVFDSQDQVASHQQDPGVCSPVPEEQCPFEEKATEEQMQLIRTRLPGIDPATAWYLIYSILFPGEALPPSPYRDQQSQFFEGADFTHFFDAFLSQPGRESNLSLQDHDHGGHMAEVDDASAALALRHTSFEGDLYPLEHSYTSPRQPPSSNSNVPTIPATPVPIDQITPTPSLVMSSTSEILSAPESPEPSDTIFPPAQPDLIHSASPSCLSDFHHPISCADQPGGQTPPPVVPIKSARPPVGPTITAFPDTQLSLAPTRLGHVATSADEEEVSHALTPPAPDSPSNSVTTQVLDGRNSVESTTEGSNVGERNDTQSTTSRDGGHTSELSSEPIPTTANREVENTNVDPPIPDMDIQTPVSHVSDTHKAQGWNTTNSEDFSISPATTVDFSADSLGVGCDEDGEGFSVHIGDQPNTLFFLQSDLDIDEIARCRIAISDITEADGRLSAHPPMLLQEPNVLDLSVLQLNSAEEIGASTSRRLFACESAVVQDGRRLDERRPFTSKSTERLTKAGQLEEPVRCVTWLVHRDTCPPKCAVWESIDVYSVQRHEMTTHKSFYSPSQMKSIKAIGRTRRPEDRYLAIVEIASGKKYEGKRYPYRSELAYSGSTSVSPATLSNMGNGATPASVERMQLLQTLQASLAEHFDEERASIRQDRIEAEAELNSHLRRALQQEAKDAIERSIAAKCQAMRRLTKEFEEGASLDINSMITGFTGHCGATYVDRHRALEKILSLYATTKISLFVDREADSTAPGKAPASTSYCKCELEARFGCIKCGKEIYVNMDGELFAEVNEGIAAVP